METIIHTNFGAFITKWTIDMFFFAPINCTVLTVYYICRLKEQGKHFFLYKYINWFYYQNRNLANKYILVNFNNNLYWHICHIHSSKRETILTIPFLSLLSFFALIYGLNRDLQNRRTSSKKSINNLYP